MMDARGWARWWRLAGKAGLVDLLSRDWDPIGHGPELPDDEYDCVAGSVASLLRSGAPAGDVAATLSQHRTEHFGLDADLPRDRRVAEATIAWYVDALQAAPDVAKPVSSRRPA